MQAGNNRYGGFSLLELSIVLVAIGLLVGGLLVASNLIRSSEVRAIITEIHNYRVAVQNFHTRYDALPGDMDYATRLWGAVNTDPNTCFATATTTGSTATCNGNGNGQIRIWDGPGGNEGFRAWQHLSNAGLVGGQFPGISDGSSANREAATVGYNVPESQMKGVGFTLNSFDTHTGHANWFDGPYKNVMFVGTQNDDWETHNPFLTPAEALSVDSKEDDGKPSTGVIRTFKSPIHANCITSDDDDLAAYDVSQADITCSFIVTVF